MCGQHARDVVLVAEAVALRYVNEALPASGARGVSPAACSWAVFDAIHQGLGRRAELTLST